MIPDEISDALFRTKSSVRLGAWHELLRRRPEIDLTPADMARLAESLKHEPTLQVRTKGTVIWLQLRDWKSESLQDLLLSDFLPSRRGTSDSHAVESLVVAVCDQQNIRDVHSLVQMARLLPLARYPATQFHQISLASPSWDGVPLDNLHAICMIGRPTMFLSSRLLDRMPTGLRFSLPGDDLKWRDVPLTAKSIKRYRHVRQSWPGVPVVSYAARETKGIRTDYAVVQRFRVPLGTRSVAVLVLGGGTSLGTAGAADWVSRCRLDDLTIPQIKQKTNVDVDESSIVEVLLRVTAPVHTPPLPWRPTCVVEKLFVNGSVNAVSTGPRLITLVGGLAGPDKVNQVLFDHDGVSLPDEARTALIALCLQTIRTAGEIDLSRLVQNAAVWPGSRSFLSERTQAAAARFYVDNLQKYRLKKSLVVRTKTPKLRLDAKVMLT